MGLWNCKRVSWVSVNDFLGDSKTSSGGLRGLTRPNVSHFCSLKNLSIKAWGSQTTSIEALEGQTQHKNKFKLFFRQTSLHQNVKHLVGLLMRKDRSSNIGYCIHDICELIVVCKRLLSYHQEPTYDFYFYHFFVLAQYLWLDPTDPFKNWKPQNPTTDEPYVVASYPIKCFTFLWPEIFVNRSLRESNNVDWSCKESQTQHKNNCFSVKAKFKLFFRQTSLHQNVKHLVGYWSNDFEALVS